MVLCQESIRLEADRRHQFVVMSSLQENHAFAGFLLLFHLAKNLQRLMVRKREINNHHGEVLSGNIRLCLGYRTCLHHVSKHPFLLQKLSQGLTKNGAFIHDQQRPLPVFFDHFVLFIVIYLHMDPHPPPRVPGIHGQEGYSQYYKRIMNFSQ